MAVPGGGKQGRSKEARKKGTSRHLTASVGFNKPIEAKVER